MRSNDNHSGDGDLLRTFLLLWWRRKLDLDGKYTVSHLSRNVVGLK
jgi:hypothetical protein